MLTVSVALCIKHQYLAFDVSLPPPNYLSCSPKQLDSGSTFTNYVNFVLIPSNSVVYRPEWPKTLHIKRGCHTLWLQLNYKVAFQRITLCLSNIVCMVVECTHELYVKCVLGMKAKYNISVVFRCYNSSLLVQPKFRPRRNGFYRRAEMHKNNP